MPSPRAVCTEAPAAPATGARRALSCTLDDPYVRAPLTLAPRARPRSFMRRPAEYLPAFEEAVRESIRSMDPSMAKTVEQNVYRIGVTGTFGSHHVSPRGLGSELLNSVVIVEGIVTKCSIANERVDGRAARPSFRGGCIRSTPSGHL